MFNNNMNLEEHFSTTRVKTPPCSAAGPGHGGTSLRQDNQESSWISKFSVVSRPALSFLQKVLPGGRARAPALLSDNLQTHHISLSDSLSTHLSLSDNLSTHHMSLSDSLSTHHLAYLHYQRDSSWLTDSLAELGIQDSDEMNIKQQRASSIGYFSAARSFLSQVVLSAPLADTGHILGGTHTWSAAVGSPLKNSSINRWGGFWAGTEDKHTQSWLSNLSLSKEIPGGSSHAQQHQHSSDHCIQPESSTMAAVAKPTELFAQCHDVTVESMHGESAGPACHHKEERTDNDSLQTDRPESLSSSQGFPLEEQHRGLIAVGAGAATPCSEVAVLTPDQDNGYSSLEEEHSTCRLYMAKEAPCCGELRGLTDMTGDGASTAACVEKLPEEETREQRDEEEESAAGGEMDRAEEEEEGTEDSDVSDSEEEEEEETTVQEGASSADAPSLLATPTCQNKAIAYIMGTPCSDDSQSDDSPNEEDDDGFDSEGSSEFSDSEDDDVESGDSDEDESDSERVANEEAERLWNSLCRSTDPYNPRNFTAAIQSVACPRAIPPNTITSSSSACSPHSSPLNQPPCPLLLSSSPLASPPSPSPLQEESWDESSASEVDEAENTRLWNSFSAFSDPYSPLNFQGPLRTRVTPPCPAPAAPPRVRGKKCRAATMPRSSPPHQTSSPPRRSRREEEEAAAEERLDSGFSESLATIAMATTMTITAVTSARCVTVKKVCFSEQVEEFYAEEEEDRRGPWEELARDRCRFLRRVQEVEEDIGYVLAPAFRSLAYQRLCRLPHPHHS